MQEEAREEALEEKALDEKALEEALAKAIEEAKDDLKYDAEVLSQGRTPGSRTRESKKRTMQSEQYLSLYKCYWAAVGFIKQHHGEYALPESAHLPVDDFVLVREVMSERQVRDEKKATRAAKAMKVMKVAKRTAKAMKVMKKMRR